jgi:hypothetical protein
MMSILLEHLGVMSTLVPSRSSEHLALKVLSKVLM